VDRYGIISVKFCLCVLRSSVRQVKTGVIIPDSAAPALSAPRHIKVCLFGILQST